MTETRTRRVAAPAPAVFAAFSAIGGRHGWYHANWAWSLRGLVDRALGGAGLRRGRRHPDELRNGDALDFWRVESVEQGKLLRLQAEMKLPGRAWLQFEAQPLTPQSCLLRQTAYFAPKGVPGYLYCYLLYPIHGWVFGGLVRAVRTRAERSAAAGEGSNQWSP